MSGAIELSDANKTIEYSGSPQEIDQQCEALAALDAKAEKLKVAAIIALVMSVLIGFISFASQTLPGIALAVLLGVGALILYFSMNAEDIEDRKLEIARNLLRILQTELRDGRPSHLSMDFRGYDNHHSDGVWLNLKTVLHDGVGVQLEVSTHHKRKTRAKRKYTKIKDKIWERVTLKLSPPKGKRFDPAAAQRLRRLPVPKMAVRSSKVAPKAATFVYETRRMVRVRNRYGWQDQNLTDLVDENMSLAALIASYRALATANPSATG